MNNRIRNAEAFSCVTSQNLCFFFIVFLFDRIYFLFCFVSFLFGRLVWFELYFIVLSCGILRSLNDFHSVCLLWYCIFVFRLKIHFPDIFFLSTLHTHCVSTAHLHTPYTHNECTKCVSLKAKTGNIVRIRCT